jgi:2-haloacid dehalogenase
MKQIDSLDRRSVVAAMATIGIAAIATPLRLWAAERAGVPQVLAFNVTGSILDLQSLRPLFQRVFGKPEMVDTWYGETILYSETATITDTFVPFAQLGEGVFRMLGRIHDVVVSRNDLSDLNKGLASLPPHPEAPEALQQLKSAGYRLVTLTDSSATPGQGPLHAAGLEHLFERQFAAEAVQRYKPSRDAYLQVSRATGVTLSGLCMVSAHPWDLIGATAAGCSAAIVERAGVAPLAVPGLMPPDFRGSTLHEVADQLVHLKRA